MNKKVFIYSLSVNYSLYFFKIIYQNIQSSMKNFLKSITINRFFTGLCFFTATLDVSAQTISYDSIQDNGTRNDTLTFVEDFADTKYALNSLFASNDSLSFQLKKINANGAISATVADDTLTISSLANGYGQASVEVTATNTADRDNIESADQCNCHSCG